VKADGTVPFIQIQRLSSNDRVRGEVLFYGPEQADRIGTEMAFLRACSSSGAVPPDPDGEAQSDGSDSATIEIRQHVPDRAVVRIMCEAYLLEVSEPAHALQSLLRTVSHAMARCHASSVMFTRCSLPPRRLCPTSPTTRHPVWPGQWVSLSQAPQP
jgi:hypothetical protein